MFLGVVKALVIHTSNEQAMRPLSLGEVSLLHMAREEAEEGEKGRVSGEECVRKRGRGSRGGTSDFCFLELG